MLLYNADARVIKTINKHDFEVYSLGSELSNGVFKYNRI